MSSKKCLYSLKQAESLIGEGITMLENPSPDEDNSLMAFVELVQEAQNHLNSGLHAAIRPALTPPDLEYDNE